MVKGTTEKSYNVTRPEPVLKAYRDRLKVLKKAQELSAMDEIPKAVQHYSLYLNTLAQYFDVPESSLSPACFSKEQDLAEMLLISHTYWDLAKAYDRSPSLTMESIRCLAQFVKFTLGFKYQYANSQMVKKYIRKGLAHNPKPFKDAFEKIRIEAKGCYIATHCYGSAHPITASLRNYRDVSLQSNIFGRFFISTYECISPYLVKACYRYPPLTKFFDPIFHLLIRLFLKLTKIKAQR
ncbi:MAG: hypothetical protein CME71_07375 [Halobacteriovorax sp.]|nr:hypothetical protein [Halobacteriovorax sp.]